MKAVEAGKYRHVVTIQRRTEVVDPDTGYREWTWVHLLTDVPASWLPGPGREFLAGEALRSEVQGRFMLRWSPAMSDVHALDRVVWDGSVYDIKSDPLVDETARREVTLMVARGVSDG